MTHEASIAALLERFRTTSRFLITSHCRPDGDAIGSALGLAEILNQFGCETQIILADPPPDIYMTLPGIDKIRVSNTTGDDDTPAIILECDSTERTGLAGLEHRQLVNIDHHASGRRYAHVNWIDEHACAVAEMIYRLAIAAKVKITPSIATCLYTAILSDTGCFTFPSTNATTLALGHELASHGASPSEVARDLYFSNPESKVRLLAVALSNMQREGPLAWSWVTDADMERTKASAEDCEGVVNYLIGIAGIESAVFLREVPFTGEFRLNIRSKGTTDVAAVAAAFGGGGHRRASGCTLPGPLSAATDKILSKLRVEVCEPRLA